MKKSRKILLLVITLITIFMVMAVTSFADSGSDDWSVGNYKGFEYEIYEEEASIIYYTGSAIMPEVTSVTLDSVNILDHVNITYSNNIGASSTALITVTGKDNYTGTISTYFTINKVALNPVLTFSVNGNNATNGEYSLEFTGSPLSIAYTIYDINNNIVDESDYIIEYKKKHPHVAFKIVFNLGEANYEDYDIIIDEKRDTYDEFQKFELCHLKFYIMAAKNSPLCQKTYSLKQLANQDFVSMTLTDTF